jgi:AraC-like DNA-binding protein
MTITISQQAYDELLDETAQQYQQSDPEDRLDLIYPFPSTLGQGYVREIQLREGLGISIDNFRLRDRWIFARPDRNNWLMYHFHLSGQHKDKYTEVDNNQYALYGCGIARKDAIDCPNKYPVLEVTIYMQPEILCSFIGNSQQQLPAQFQQLIRKLDREPYTRVGAIAPTMLKVLWQILRCPYQGMTKRIYLESKALEVVALLLEQEAEVQKGQPQTETIEPEKRDRIYHAREILLQHLDNPLSLMELARRVGLNECTLKREFRRIFGQTVFSYLQDYRLEQARQLLEMEDISTSEVSQMANRGYFAAIFRKKFGLNPKDYRKQLKNSV